MSVFVNIFIERWLKIDLISNENYFFQVGDHKVPVLVENLDQYHTEEFDLTSTKILPHINGFNSVARLKLFNILL